MQTKLYIPNLLQVVAYLRVQCIKGFKLLKNGAYVFRYRKNDGNCSCIVSPKVFNKLNPTQLRNLVTSSLKSLNKFKLSASVNDNANSMIDVLSFNLHSSFETGRVILGRIYIHANYMSVSIDCRKQEIQVDFSLKSAVAEILKRTTGSEKLKSADIQSIRGIVL